MCLLAIRYRVVELELTLRLRYSLAEYSQARKVEVWNTSGLPRAPGTIKYSQGSLAEYSQASRVDLWNTSGFSSTPVTIKYSQ